MEGERGSDVGGMRLPGEEVGKVCAATGIASLALPGLLSLSHFFNMQNTGYDHLHPAVSQGLIKEVIRKP